MSSTPTRPRAAFTLLELGIGLVCLAVLIVLLLAALNTARRKAQGRQNESNLRHMRNGQVEQATDNKGNLPTSSR